jgi:hypothetical protein
MSKNAKNIFYKTLAMSNDINKREGLPPLSWERGIEGERLECLVN